MGGRIVLVQDKKAYRKAPTARQSSRTTHSLLAGFERREEKGPYNSELAELVLMDKPPAGFAENIVR